MTTYRAIPNAEIDAESPGTEQTFTALRDNAIAITEGASGAPKIQEAAMDSASVNQAALKTTTDTKTTTGTGVIQVLAGGSYGFWPELDHTISSGYNIVVPCSSIIADNSTYTAINIDLTSGFANFIFLGELSAGTLSARQRYIQSSPPYNNGPLFAYAVIDNSNSEVESMSIAPDPPYANNGPTDIRPDFYRGNIGFKRIKKAKKENGKLILPIQYEILEVKITKDYKDSDMHLIPHPFIANDLTGKTVVIIEPGSDFCCELHELHETGENLNILFHDKFIIIDNQPLTMKSPTGCMAVKAKWKLTK